MSLYISLGITLILAITVHEFAHALVADNLGDPTPRSQGRVTLNPLAHLDPFGSLLFIVSGFGWGRPVLTNPRNYRVPIRTGMAIVAFAGPLSNFLMALLAAIPFRLGLGGALNVGGVGEIIPSLSDFLSIFIQVNLGLMLFNLIPISPLDGFKVALGVLPDQWANALAGLEQVGPILLLLLVVSGRIGEQFGFGFNLLGFLVGPAQQGLFNLLVG
ncbi:MAG: site-2 protease family protein [Chloroflexi bacterium]|nr:site-2 protease family protein [Chloroflexota bacterium]